jgi:hypothetical protein
MTRVWVGVAAACAGALVILSAAETSARMPFDGNWSVSIWTEKGECDRGYRYELKIDNGQVTYRGRERFDISGRVDGGGFVRVNVSRGDRNANGTGRLAASTGRGTWKGKAPSGECSGYWEAERRPN